MDAHQIELVQHSFARVLTISETAADLFYGKLFDLDPSLRPMFKSDLKEQGRKLMQMLRVAVNGLTRLDAILPAVEALGRRHVAYGVREEHYDTVAEALLWTLGQGLGDDFTPDVQSAWAAAYALLAGAMIQASA